MELTMKLDETADGSTTAVVALSGSVTIRDSSEVKEALASALAAADRVLLDLGGVTEADPSFMQFLCSTRRTAEETGRELVLVPEPSAAFVDAVLATGFPSAGCFATGGDSSSREENPL